MNSGEFSEQILADLIAQGFSGQELLEKFKEQSKKVRPAVKKLIEEVQKQQIAGVSNLNRLSGPYGYMGLHKNSPGGI
jgi:DNA invertase Pin-like site-specific DNA recombinase